MKKPKLVISVLSVLCAVLLITLTVNLYNYNVLLNPKNTHKHTSLCFAEGRAYFIIDGTEYRRADESDIPKTVTPDKFLGYISDYEGFFSRCTELERASGLYTVKEDPKLIASCIAGSTTVYAPYEK